MKRARLRALIVFMIAAVGALALALEIRRSAPELPRRSPEHRPRLLLLTSLPLLFGETFALPLPASPAIKRLKMRYRLAPISTTDPSELAKGRLLLMAQPQAQTAENLVALDAWVRGGGRVLLLADPLLEWPSNQPLGDITRPPPMFMDTGLLLHWGLRLESPGKRGPAERKLGGYPIMTVSPGVLGGKCAISPDGLVAHCRLGRGAATIVADADLLNIQQLGQEGRHNLDGLLAELASLEQA